MFAYCDKTCPNIERGQFDSPVTDLESIVAVKYFQNENQTWMIPKLKFVNYAWKSNLDDTQNLIWRPWVGDKLDDHLNLGCRS